jgi:hypothetical protein
LELHARVLDRGLIGTNHRVERCRRGTGGVALLARADTAFDEIFHPLGNDLGVLRLSGVALEIGFGLVQRRLEWAGIEHEQNLTGLDIVSLAEVDVLEFARHLGPNRDGRVRLDCSNGSDRQRHFLLNDAVNGDWNGLRPAPLRCLGASGRARGRYDGNRQGNA